MLIMVASFDSNVFAAEYVAPYEIQAYAGYSIITSKEERDLKFEKEMKQIISELESDAGEKGSKYHYKAEYLPYQYKTVSGYAGNQIPGGYRFSTGGGFWYTETGGPSIPVSISLSLPSPYNVLSLNVKLGKNSNSGQFVTAPNTTDYFKLYVDKTVEIRPYAVYRTESGTESWQLYTTGGVTVTYSVNAYAKKV